MIISQFEDKKTGLRAHVCMIRMNEEIYFTVDVYDDMTGQFLPIVKTFPPAAKKEAISFAQLVVSA
jgi:hypothetical protein